MRAEIIVTPKRSVLDPQGEAVKRAIHGLGMESADSVRVGKFIELEIGGKNENARDKLQQICRDLLSNPVIEDFELKLFKEGKLIETLINASPAAAKNSEGDKKKKKKKKKKDKEKKKDKKKKK